MPYVDAVIVDPGKDNDGIRDTVDLRVAWEPGLSWGCTRTLRGPSRTPSRPEVTRTGWPVASPGKGCMLVVVVVVVVVLV